MAHSTLGIIGTNRISKFEGKWVNTIVLSKPIRRAIAGAARKGQSGENIGAEENPAQGVQIGLVTEKKPVGDDALDDERAGESVEGEKPGELGDDAAGFFQTDLACCRFGFLCRFDVR